MKHLIITLSIFSLTACATSGQGSKTASNAPSNTKHAQPILGAPDATPFTATANAQSEVAAALGKAKAEGKLGLVVMGANWCHDSRALAGQFQTARFQSLLAENYELVYVDVGMKDKNLDVAKSFGLEAIEGTPTVIVTGASGQVLNLEDAPTWRNAASRSSDDIYTYFTEFAEKNKAGGA